MKIVFSIVWRRLIWSQSQFAHTKTAQLSWYVQIFIVIRHKYQITISTYFIKWEVCSECFQWESWQESNRWQGWKRETGNWFCFNRYFNWYWYHQKGNNMITRKIKHSNVWILLDFNNLHIIIREKAQIFFIKRGLRSPHGKSITSH